MPQIPPLAELEKHYPGPGGGSAESVVALVGGTVKKNFDESAAYRDTCCVRVSRSLNYGGDPIPAAGGGIANPYMDHKRVRTYKGGDGKWYICSCYDIRAYLVGRYGHAKKANRFPGTASMEDLAGVTGIIAFGFWHIDIWNGTSCVGHNRGFSNAKVREILVWTS